MTGGRRLLTLSRAPIVFPHLDPQTRQAQVGCTWFLRTDSPWAEDKGRAAEIGTAVHGLAEVHVVRGEEKTQHELAKLASQFNPSDHAQIAAMYAQWCDWYATLPAGLPISAEIELWWEPNLNMAGQCITPPGADPKNRATKYAGTNPDTMVAGTVDLLVDHGELVEVIDIKTGRSPVPPTSAQLLGLACAAATWKGKNKARATVVTVHEDQWYSASVDLDTHTIDWVHDLFLGPLHDKLAPAQPNPGPWCKWCPARDQCPATVQALATLANNAGLDTYRFSTKISGPQHAAWTLAALDVAKNYMERVENALKAYVDANGPLDLPGNLTYSARQETTQTPRLTSQGVAALRAMGLGAAVKQSTTWKDIERVGGKQQAQAARAKLEELGCVGSYDKTVYRVRKKQ